MTASLVALALGTLVSEDLTTIGAGLLVARGEMDPAAAVLACVAGIYAGDLGLWAIGRVAGPRVLGWKRVAPVLTQSGAQQFSAWLSRHMAAAVLASRFAPGTRLPLYLAAGASGTSFKRFAVWSLLAVGIWTPAVVALSAFLGDRIAM